ncbi:TIGR00730 family Rossman fold protein, partial [Betaproteobacteria bacterium PRO4]|nr:TIGR00730 family Rossman fold protein [Betaproteobacteria bacterium PRO4]
VVMPGGFGTLDELMEALTLVQTGKTRKMPIILVCSDFWTGMIDWFREALVRDNFISEEDIDLIQIVDEPSEVVDAIFRFYETSGFEPSAAERNIQLNL